MITTSVTWTISMDTILMCDRHSINDFLSKHPNATKAIRNTLLNNAAQKFPEATNLKPIARKSVMFMCDDIHIINYAIRKNELRYLLNAYKQTPAKDAITRRLEGAAAAPATGTSGAEISGGAPADAATPTAVAADAAAAAVAATPTAVAAVAAANPTAITAVDTADTQPAVIDEDGDQDQNVDSDAIHTRVTPNASSGTHTPPPQTNNCELQKKYDNLQIIVDTLSRNLLSLNFNYSQELTKCRNASAQKDLQITGLQQDLYSLTQRVANCEAALRQQHPHPHQGPVQSIPVTPIRPVQHAIVTAPEVPAPPPVGPAPQSTQHAPVAPPIRSATPDTEPASSTQQPPAQPASSTQQPSVQPTSLIQQPPVQPASLIPQPPAQPASSSLHPSVTPVETAPVEQVNPTSRLRAKHIIPNTKDIFVGNLLEDMTERELQSLIFDAGMDINENEIKVEDLQIRTQDKGKAFKVTIPQSKYQETCCVIKSTNKSVKVEQYKPKKQRTTQRSQQQQNDHNRNNQRNNGRGGNRQTFRSPNNQQRNQQHHQQHQWRNNLRPQAMQGYQRDDYYHNNDYYSNNRTTNYDNFSNNWNRRW